MSYGFSGPVPYGALSGGVLLKALFWFPLCIIFLCGLLMAQEIEEQLNPNLPAGVQHQQLLNGLDIFILNQPANPRVVIKLRIHSGASFDLSGKEGTMALVGETFFSDPAVHEYFIEQLNGHLEVKTDFDYLDITMSGRASDFETMIDALRNGLIIKPLTNEIVTKVRTERIEAIGKITGSDAYLTDMADRAAVARLFGQRHPYARSINGSPESLLRITRNDLLLARERFVNPNNATLAIVGGIDDKQAKFVIRQLLGQWRKSETVTPATFRQPEQPDPRPLVIDFGNSATLSTQAPSLTHLRLAMIGLPRSNPESAACQMLARIALMRWIKINPKLTASLSSPFGRHDGRILSGIIMMGATVPIEEASNALKSGRQILESLIDTPPATDEVTDARATLIQSIGRANRADRVSDAAELTAESILDTDIGLVTSDKLSQEISRYTAHDLQQIAVKLFKDAPPAMIAMGNASLLKSSLAAIGPIEDARDVRLDPPPPANSLKLKPPPIRP